MKRRAPLFGPLQPVMVLLLLLLLAACRAPSATGPTAAATPTVTAEVLVRSTASWDGATLPAYPSGPPEVTVLKITIPPGTRLPMHYHPVINAGVLTRGQLTVRTEAGQIKHLQAGDALIEVVNTLHYGANEGTTPAEIIVVYAGVAGQAVTVKTDRAEDAQLRR